MNNKKSICKKEQFVDEVFGENVEYVKIPKVYKKYSTEKVLVLEYIKGTSIGEIDKVKKLLEENMKAAAAYCAYARKQHMNKTCANSSGATVAIAENILPVCPQIYFPQFMDDNILPIF